MTKTANQSRTVVQVDGGGGATCDDCRSPLHYSWRVWYADGALAGPPHGWLCSTCLARHPRQEG